MEAQIKVENEVETAADLFETKPIVKNKQMPIDDDDNTPLREEMSPKRSEAANATAAKWDTDDEDQIETPPMIPKRSNNLNLVDIFSPGTKQNAEKLFDIPEDYLDELLDAPLVKKEKPTASEINLDFLDSLNDWDLEGSTCNQKEMDNMDLESAAEGTSNVMEEAELEVKIKQGEKTLEKLNKRQANKNKKHEGHKKRRRYHSRSSSSRAGSIKQEPAQLDFVPVRERERSLKLININKLLATAPTAAAAKSVLTIKQKRQLAVERATKVLEIFRSQNDKEFLVVDTIRMQHGSATYMSCNPFEHPSPLCQNFNVMYKFNSTTSSNLVLAKWGLIGLPSVTTRLLRLTGIDASRLAELQRHPNMQLQKLRQQKTAENVVESAPCSAGFYKSVSTQTEQLVGLRTKDAAVQVTQTHRGIYWLDSHFDASDLSQQQSNVMLALKELCATSPSSSSGAGELFNVLKHALAIKRAERNELSTGF